MCGYQRRAVVLALAAVVLIVALIALFTVWDPPTCLEREEFMSLVCST